MALFDTALPIDWATRFTPDAGKRLERSEDGTAVVLNFWDAPLYDGSIVLPWLTEAERDTVRAFYAANKDQVFTFTHPGDGETYSLYFLNAPMEEPLQEHAGLRWKVTLAVVGTR